MAVVRCHLPSAKLHNTPNRTIPQSRLPPSTTFISTNPSHVNPVHLRDLYTSCNHSCHRFPNLRPDGQVEPVDIHKLRIALSHSSVLVSVFTRPELISHLPENPTTVGGWLSRLVPVTPFNGQLVGFGRAVSDSGLTASIYDVMVTPSLQGRGIGRMILQRIVRMLTNKGVYDVAALCSEKEMGFFKACGFGDDTLGSTTMMYTRAASTSLDSGQIVKRAARGLTRTSALWKLQWFAVGWINPNNKYCTKVDASGNANPVWKTKFSALIDNSDSDFKDLALHVEVYSREPIFLRERLQGTATVVLKEFLDKYSIHSEVSKPVEEVGSFQLRKKNSNKPQGFVDVSIRISEEKEEFNSYQGDEVGINLRPPNNGSNFPPPSGWPENHPQTNSPYDYPLSTPKNYSAGDEVGIKLRTRNNDIKPSGWPENHPQTNSPYDYPLSTPRNYSAGDEVGIKLRTRNNDIKPSGWPENHPQTNPPYDYPLSTPRNYSAGDEVGIKLRTRNNDINLPPAAGPGTRLHPNSPYEYPQQNQANSSTGRPNYSSAGGPSYQPQKTPEVPPGPSYSSGGPSYQLSRTPPPPPPPSNVGYIPTLLPRTDNLPPSYISMPSSSGAAAGRNTAPGFAMGLGAGALAAGAVIFGDDFMSGFDLPTGLQGSSVTLSTNPPF